MGAVPPQEEPLKNVGTVELRAIVRRGFWAPTMSAEAASREVLAAIKKRGRYRDP